MVEGMSSFPRFWVSVPPAHSHTPANGVVATILATATDQPHHEEQPQSGRCLLHSRGSFLSSRLSHLYAVFASLAAAAVAAAMSCPKNTYYRKKTTTGCVCLFAGVREDDSSTIYASCTGKDAPASVHKEGLPIPLKGGTNHLVPLLHYRFLIMMIAGVEKGHLPQYKHDVWPMPHHHHHHHHLSKKASTEFMTIHDRCQSWPLCVCERERERRIDSQGERI